MRRAIALAANGWGRVAPNPMVGCVIVRDGEVVGAGWHTEYGRPHTTKTPPPPPPPRAGRPPPPPPLPSDGSDQSFARRSSCALAATMIVLADMRTAPTAGDRRMPHGASTPAASGIATML